jgi:hypothetical protein
MRGQTGRSPVFWANYATEVKLSWPESVAALFGRPPLPRSQRAQSQHLQRGHELRSAQRSSRVRGDP